MISNCLGLWLGRLSKLKIDGMPWDKMVRGGKREISRSPMNYGTKTHCEIVTQAIIRLSECKTIMVDRTVKVGMFRLLSC